MTHEEQRVWLIQELLNEQPEYRRYKIPAAEQEQKNLLRALMNVRMPADISQEFEKIQDEYLQEENARAGIVDIEDLKPLKCDNRLYLWQGDMTCLKVDAITNPANSGLLGCFRPLHNCADNIVHSKAGRDMRNRPGRQRSHRLIIFPVNIFCILLVPSCRDDSQRSMRDFWPPATPPASIWRRRTA